MTRQRWCAVLAAAAIAAGCTDHIEQPAAPEPPQPAAPALAAGQYGQLQWFGYVGGSDDKMLNGTDSYANWGWFATDADYTSTAATTTINRLAQHGMKTVIDLGGLLWCGDGQRVLCPYWKNRLSGWRQRNQAALFSGNVLAFSVRDEPFWTRTNIAQMDSASREVKAQFPTAAILLIEASVAIENNSPSSWFNLYRSQLTVADWLAVDKYMVHPATDAGFQTALARMKAAWPGRRTAYAADGWWAANGAHATAFGTTNRAVMAGIMREWFDVAAADPSAIMMGVFIWDSFGEGTGSRDLPRAVTLEQMNIGRAITGRTRGNLYPPVGQITLTPQGGASGWACDPDGAWAESVQVDFFAGGVPAGTVLADKASEDALMGPCRSGLFHRFNPTQVNRLPGPVTFVVRDLSSGGTTITHPVTVFVEWVFPAHATFGQPNTLTVFGRAFSGNGNVEMWWRDASTGGAYQRAPSVPAPGSWQWSNTIPSSNYCHDYDVYAVFSGRTSGTYRYRGLVSGYCDEEARVIWIQPASRAGFGPPESLVVAGSASGAPQGTGVVLWWRNLTTNGVWVREAYEPTTDADGIWINSISNANPSHQYEVSVVYDVIEPAPCTYAGNSDITWC
jgi:hypothetical protein